MASERQGTSEIPSGLPAAGTAGMFEVPLGYQAFPNNAQAGTSPAMAPPPASGGVNGASTSGKKKRGRPRKYGPDGTAPAATKPSPNETAPPATGNCSSEQNQRKAPTAETIGEDRSSIDTTLNNFIPNMITVSPGEDVAWKIVQATQQGRRGIIIMSANGMLKEVALINPAHGIGVIKQEGQFNIIQMSGSFMMHDKEGTSSGGMSITLEDSDDRIIEGDVGGALIAATPVHVVIGSFTTEKQTIGRKAVRPDCTKNGKRSRSTGAA